MDSPAQLSDLSDMKVLKWCFTDLFKYGEASKNIVTTVGFDFYFDLFGYECSIYDVCISDLICVYFNAIG